MLSCLSFTKTDDHPNIAFPYLCVPFINIMDTITRQLESLRPLHREGLLGELSSHLWNISWEHQVKVLQDAGRHDPLQLRGLWTADSGYVIASSDALALLKREITEHVASTVVMWGGDPRTVTGLVERVRKSGKYANVRSTSVNIEDVDSFVATPPERGECHLVHFPGDHLQVSCRDAGMYADAAQKYADMEKSIVIVPAGLTTEYAIPECPTVLAYGAPLDCLGVNQHLMVDHGYECTRWEPVGMACAGNSAGTLYARDAASRGVTWAGIAVLKRDAGGSPREDCDTEDGLQERYARSSSPLFSAFRELMQCPDFLASLVASPALAVDPAARYTSRWSTVSLREHLWPPGSVTPALARAVRAALVEERDMHAVFSAAHCSEKYRQYCVQLALGMDETGDAEDAPPGSRGEGYWALPEHERSIVLKNISRHAKHMRRFAAVATANSLDRIEEGRQVSRGRIGERALYRSVHSIVGDEAILRLCYGECCRAPWQLCVVCTREVCGGPSPDNNHVSGARKHAPGLVCDGPCTAWLDGWDPAGEAVCPLPSATQIIKSRPPPRDTSSPDRGKAWQKAQDDDDENDDSVQPSIRPKYM